MIAGPRYCPVGQRPALRCEYACSGDAESRRRTLNEWPDRRRLPRAVLAAILPAGVGRTASAATAQECKNRGQLDTLYCDDNKIWSPTRRPIRKMEDPRDAGLRLHAGRGPGRLSERIQAVHRLSRQCTGKRVIYYPVQSNSAESRRCVRAACTSPASRPDRPGLP